MARLVPPLLLGRPSRFARLDRRHGRMVLAALILLMLLSLSALALPSPQAARSATGNDVYLYDSIVAGLRGGGDYYSVAAQALRAGDFPLKPFFTFRLPTLAVIEAALPDWGTVALLYLLALSVALAWYGRIREAMSGVMPRIVAMLLLLAGMLACLQSGLVDFHEIWAAQLIALSLALRRPGRWIEAVAIGLAAMMIRETSALYVGLMAVIAWIEGERRESSGWGIAIAIFAIVVTVHAIAVGHVVRALDPASPGWAGFNGFGLFIRAETASTALAMLPQWIAGFVIVLALIGWAGWETGLGQRVIATIAGYALLISVAARLDTFYWGLMVAPLVPLGLIFAPDAIRDLVRTTLDRRRVTVQRINR